MATKSKDEVTSNLAKLSLKTTELETTPASQPRAKSQSKSKGSPVADSWEDEADEDDETPDTAQATPVVAPLGHAGTSAPPPTPMSPLGSANKRPFSPSALPGPGFSIPPFEGAGDYSGSSSSSGGPSKRPEKTDAVARRMIASALGMRAPRPTEEQRAYDRAVREKEKKRREEEKEQEKLREEAAAKARQAIWDD